jgi:hypothetical protein
MTIAIVIPIYKKEVSEWELMSLKQCITVLKAYPIIFVCSEELDVKWYDNKCVGCDIAFERFEAKYFISIKGYNRLLTSDLFYTRFLDYKYILIYQLDAYIFFDQLQHWCELNYDYIGAPWIDLPWHANTVADTKRTILRDRSLFSKIAMQIRWHAKRLLFNYEFKVGNGGLSLRKVLSCYRALLKINADGGWDGNEDGFWSVYVPLKMQFRIPGERKALQFAFDANPADAYNRNGAKLPMACHAWYRTDHPYETNLDFWKNFIQINVANNFI